jgi:hypothetical protein
LSANLDSLSRCHYGKTVLGSNIAKAGIVNPAHARRTIFFSTVTCTAAVLRGGYKNMKI